MAVMTTPGGNGYTDLDDKVVSPKDTKVIAQMRDARDRELSLELEQLQALVAALGDLAGIGVGSPTDAATAALVLQAGSRTNSAVTQVAQTILDRAGDLGLTAAVPVSTFGAVGDGRTDDTAALQAAAASEKVVVFDGAATYAFNGAITLTAGTQWITRGATLYETASANRPCLVLESHVTVDRLVLSQAGGENCRGIFIKGDNVVVGDIECTARERAGLVSDIRRRALVIGEEGTGCTDVQIGEVRLKNYVRPMVMWEAADVTIGTLNIEGFVQGCYIRNGRRVRIGGGWVTQPHLDIATGGPGENGFLISTDGTRHSGDVDLESVVVVGAPEHGFRVGGQSPINGIRFDKCRAAWPGSKNVAGGCGFKVLGPTTEVATVRHEDIRFLDCMVVDGTWKSAPNFAGFHIGKCHHVTITNPVVRTLDAKESTYFGIVMVGSEAVTITNPNIENTAGPGIALHYGTDTDTISWGTAATAITVNGGLLRGCARGVQIKSPTTIRRLVINGLSIEGGDYSLWSDTTDMNRCVANVHTWYPSVGTAYGCAGLLAHVAGDIVGTPDLRNGSTYQDWATGAHRLRRGDAWVQLAAA